MCLLFSTCPSFLLGQLGTFALVKLPTLWWGTLFIKMRSYLLEVLNRVLTELCLYMCSFLVSLVTNDLFSNYSCTGHVIKIGNACIVKLHMYTTTQFLII